MHSRLTARYLQPTVIGICLASGYILSRARFGAIALFAVFVFSSAGVLELSFWRSPRSHPSEVHLRGASSEQFINGAGHRELPVVVPNGLLFVWLAHYTSPSFADRSVYLTKDPPPNDPNWADTLDKGIQLLQSYWPIRWAQCERFDLLAMDFLALGYLPIAISVCGWTPGHRSLHRSLEGGFFFAHSRDRWLRLLSNKQIRKSSSVPRRPTSLLFDFKIAHFRPG
jgi:hypothetical protein